MRLYVLQSRKIGTNEWISDDLTFSDSKKAVENYYDHATREQDFEVNDLYSAQKAIAFYEKRAEVEYRIASTDHIDLHDAQEDEDWWS